MDVTTAVQEALASVTGTIVVGFNKEPTNRIAFAPGSLPVAWAPTVTTTDAVRRTYFQERCADLLYGSTEASTIRSHHLPTSNDLRLPAGDGSSSAIVVKGLERLDGEDRSLAVVHIDCSSSSAFSELANVLRPAPGADTETPLAAWLRDYAGWDEPIERGRRLYSSILVVPRGELPLRTEDGDPAITVDQMAWIAAALAPPEAFEPDPEDPFAGGERVFLSSSWRAMMLRDGCGYVMRKHGLAFQARAESLVRTVYTDVLLLSASQRLKLNEVANTASRIASKSDSEALTELTSELARIRNQLWWDDVSSHRAANMLLQASQRQWATPELLTRVTNDLQAYRADVDSRALQAARSAQRAQLAQQERLERTLKRFAAAFAGATVALAFLGANVRGITSDDGVPVLVAVLVPAVAALAGFCIAAAFERWHVTWIARSESPRLDGEEGERNDAGR